MRNSRSLTDLLVLRKGKMRVASSQGRQVRADQPARPFLTTSFRNLD